MTGTASFYSSRPGAPKNAPLGPIDKPKIFKLSSGRKVKFFAKHISHDAIEKETRVSAHLNPRIQEEINHDELLKLAESLEDNQIYPAIGYLEADNVIEVLDGSLRRAGCLLGGVGYDVLYSKEQLTLQEALDLTEQFSLVMKHTHREEGAKFLRHITHLQRNSETEIKVEQKELARIFNKSESYISTCLTAISINVNLIKLFDHSEALVAKDYRELKKVQEVVLTSANISKCDKGATDNDLEEYEHKVLDAMSEAVKSVSEELKLFRANSETKEVEKDFVFKLLAQHLMGKKKAPAKAAKFEPIVSINKNKFVRKKQDSTGNKVTFEFSRIEKDKLKQIEDYILKITSEK
ncbi:ParB family protein [Shewanella sp. MBTL60-007]|uniref:ParB family protein n=1 Tax=Shewanella sp. MBTL60-007 TaxID=2815911 RepID=UPI001BBDB6D2|nr:ParB family protein [Shewanella sp. MBTL60-007]GIU31455.1 chromosome partitioning protein ParB [Shewanella sp. MBTL60-007]